MLRKDAILLRCMNKAGMRKRMITSEANTQMKAIVKLQKSARERRKKTALCSRRN